MLRWLYQFLGGLESSFVDCGNSEDSKALNILYVILIKQLSQNGVDLERCLSAGTGTLRGLYRFGAGFSARSVGDSVRRAEGTRSPRVKMPRPWLGLFAEASPHVPGREESSVQRFGYGGEFAIKGSPHLPATIATSDSVTKLHGCQAKKIT